MNDLKKYDQYDLIEQQQLNEIDHEELPNFYFISAVILHVKACDEKKQYYNKTSQKIKKDCGTMIIFRENFDEGNIFYSFISNDDLQGLTAHMSNECWLGMDVLILNPEIRPNYKETTVMKITYPIYPLSRLGNIRLLNMLPRTERYVTNNLGAIVENQIHPIR